MKSSICIETLLKRLKLNQNELAEKIGVNPLTIWRWKKNGIPQNGAARALLERLAKEHA
jgi:transcriptional regulator with XRE-family HTH domain